MKTTLLALLVAGTATLPLLTQANSIDIGGGWVAVLPDGSEIYGLHDPADVTTASTFYTKGVNGTLSINQNNDTLVGIAGSFSGHINVSSFTSDLTINSQHGQVFAASANNTPALTIGASTGANVTINDGYYSGKNPGWSTANAASGGSLSGMSTLTLNSTSFQGGEGNQAPGSAALRLSGIGTVIIDNYADDGQNSFVGGDGDTRNNSGRDYNGGDGAILSSSTIFATNLYASGGDAGGSSTFTGTFLSTGTYTRNGNGGDGISGSSTITAISGELTGGDSTGAIYGFENDHPLYGDANVTVSGTGGTALSGTYANSRFKNITFTGGGSGVLQANSENEGSVTTTLNGGSAISASMAGTTIENSVMYGGDAGEVIMSEYANIMTVNANGGIGLVSSGTAVNLQNNTLQGGDGGEVQTIIATSGTLNANGAAAAQGAMNTYGSKFVGGHGGEILESYGATITANASGGDGATLSGTSTITNGTFIGGQGGSIRVKAGSSVANGGSGINQTGGVLEIHNGTFRGGKGGNVSADTAQVSGGHGIIVENATLNIMGGQFVAGSSGGTTASTKTTEKSSGLYAIDSDVSINGENAAINKLTYTTTTGSSHSLSLLSGSLVGDMLISGEGTTSLTVSNRFSTDSALVQEGGTVQMALTSSDNAGFFKKVSITDGTMLYTNHVANIASGSRFNLNGTASELAFGQGAIMGNKSSINAGENKVSATTGDLVLNDSASINLKYNTTFDTNGVSSLNGGQIVIGTGNLVVSNTTAAVNVNGTLSTADNVLQLTTGGLNFGTNNLDDVVNTDFGWLIKTTLTDDSGVKATTSFQSLQDGELGDINADVLDSIETNIMNSSEADFYAFNKAGSDSMRFAVSQLPDTSESSFQAAQQINRQIAARGTEYRSMNGFASTKPKLGTQPTGVAGPDGEDEKTIQAWIRAYGSTSSADKKGNFAAYDGTAWGTIIGVDKSFGNLLVGLAGGYGSTSLDGAYDATIDTYHGSIYSTVGGEKLFVDLALTYGQANTEEKTTTGNSDFDSDLLSFYIGSGYTFDVKEKAAITPELSLLSTLYNQDSFSRNTSVSTGIVDDYDSSSFLSSLGVNISTVHQIDWLNSGIAMIPELRLHWMHEFNAEQDDFNYNVNGIGFRPFAVRSRDEDTARVGLGLDMWSWKSQNTKLELDYDGLFSDSYAEHVVSGKITLRF